MASLKPTAREFVRAAFARMEPKVETKEPEPWGPPRWESSGGNSTHFHLREPSLTREEWCLIDEFASLSTLRESSALDAAFLNDTRVAPFLGRLVGTAFSAVGVNEEELRKALLWDVLRAGGTSLSFSEDAFSRGYDQWLSELLAKTQEVAILAPVSLKFGGSLDLGEQVEITQLTDEEVSACLSMAVIETTFPMRSDFAWVRSRTGIRVRYELPRRARDDETLQEEVDAARSTGDSALSRADEVVEALRVFTRGRVRITGRVALPGGGAMSGGATGGPRYAEQDLLQLDDPKAFGEFWRVFRRARANRVIDVVVRRFSYAGERTRRDDEIVDLIASLESLVLSDIRDHAELKFRTALRSALFIDGSGLTRQQVQTQLGRGYNVRSRVAHGNEPKSSDLKAPTGEQITLDEFVEGVEELVRLAVRKAVEAVGTGNPWPPDWDALTLEGVTYPLRRKRAIRPPIRGLVSSE